VARTPRRDYRLVRKYAGVRVGNLSAPLREAWVSPWHEPSDGFPQAEKLGHPLKVLLVKAIQDRAERLEKLEPDADADALYTRAETEVLAWFARSRPTKERLERKLLGRAAAVRPMKPVKAAFFEAAGVDRATAKGLAAQHEALAGRVGPVARAEVLRQLGLRAHTNPVASPKPGRPSGWRRGPSDDVLRAAFLELPPRIRRSKLRAATRLQRQFPAVPISTLRQRLAKVDK
jgi:hypothetical protein